jgi:hypothetical protein
MTVKIPIACALTDGELRLRRKDYLDKIADSLIDFEELGNGFKYRFPSEKSILLDLVNIIDLERKCCPFLDFKLIFEAGSDFVLLELTGAESAKEMIKLLFAWN